MGPAKALQCLVVLMRIVEPKAFVEKALGLDLPWVVLRIRIGNGSCGKKEGDNGRPERDHIERDSPEVSSTGALLAAGVLDGPVGGEAVVVVEEPAGLRTAGLRFTGATAADAERGAKTVAGAGGGETADGAGSAFISGVGATGGAGAPDDVEGTSRLRSMTDTTDAEAKRRRTAIAQRRRWMAFVSAANVVAPNLSRATLGGPPGSVVWWRSMSPPYHGHFERNALALKWTSGLVEPAKNHEPILSST